MAAIMAQEFLEHRRKALEHLAAMPASSSVHLAPSRYHLREGLRLLMKVLAMAAQAKSTCSEEQLTMAPLFKTGMTFHRRLEELNDQAGTLFDEELASFEEVLSACGRILKLDEKSDACEGEATGDQKHSTQTAASCGACGAKDDLDEDVDNPGDWYCVSCWLSYAGADGMTKEGCASDIDEKCWSVWEEVGVLDSEERSLQKRSLGVEERQRRLEDLLALKETPNPNNKTFPDDLYEGLGHSSAESLLAMRARCPGFAGSGTASKHKAAAKQKDKLRRDAKKALRLNAKTPAKADEVKDGPEGGEGAACRAPDEQPVAAAVAATTPFADGTAGTEDTDVTSGSPLSNSS